MRQGMGRERAGGTSGGGGGDGGGGEVGDCAAQEAARARSLDGLWIVSAGT